MVGNWFIINLGYIEVGINFVEKKGDWDRYNYFCFE